jgi:hypothetical protein
MKAAGSSKHGFGSSLLDHWLDGGISWTNTLTKTDGGVIVICQPEKMALGDEIVHSAIKQFLGERPDLRKGRYGHGLNSNSSFTKNFPLC